MTTSATVVPLAHLPKGPIDFIAALAKKRKESLPLIMSIESACAARALPASEQHTLAHKLARALVPRVARPPSPKPISIKPLRTVKIGAFRRPLGSMFPPQVSVPVARAIVVALPQPSEVNLIPLWLLQGLSWGGSTEAFSLPVGLMQIPSDKKLITPVTKHSVDSRKAEKFQKFKKQLANKKHSKKTKKAPKKQRSKDGSAKHPHGPGLPDSKHASVAKRSKVHSSNCGNKKKMAARPRPWYSLSSAFHSLSLLESQPCLAQTC
jgi:hypothetical protein